MIRWLLDRISSSRAMREGVVDAERRLEEAHAQDEEIRTLAQTLRRYRQRNNFAMMIDAALRGHR